MLNSILPQEPIIEPIIEPMLEAGALLEQEYNHVTAQKNDMKHC